MEPNAQSAQTPDHGRHLVKATVAIVSLLTIVLLWASFCNASLFVVVFSVGTVGGLLNTYRRFNLIPSEQLMAPGEAGWQITLQIYLSPLIGGLFGLVLYLAFLSGIVKGDAFPEFSCLGEKYVDVQNLLDSCVPKEKKDAAKAMFWAFVAGFFEWFVPNLLGRYARKA